VPGECGGSIPAQALRGAVPVGAAQFGIRGIEAWFGLLIAVDRNATRESSRPLASEEFLSELYGGNLGGLRGRGSREAREGLWPVR
jgi:hypothetical protein